MLATELLAAGMHVDSVAALCVLLSSFHHFFLRPYGVLTPQRLLNQLSIC